MTINKSVKNFAKSHSILKRLGVLTIGIMVWSIGFFGTSHHLKAKAVFAACGSTSNCYSVPDGCGVGVGCIKTTCNHTDCPKGDGTADPCHYCDSTDPIEN